MRLQIFFSVFWVSRLAKLSLLSESMSAPSPAHRSQDHNPTQHNSNSPIWRVLVLPVGSQASAFVKWMCLKGHLRVTAKCIERKAGPVAGDGDSAGEKDPQKDGDGEGEHPDRSEINTGHQCRTGRRFDMLLSRLRGRQSTTIRCL